MKKSGTKTTGISKGAPSGFVISLGIHAAAFFLAGMLVVFNVVKKEEKKFVPPKPVERPKMKLKKPKVKVKKSSKPKATTRIVTKVTKASMPDIQLPEMSGISGDLGGGVGGFDILPDLTEVSQFGATDSIGSDLVGTYYDFNRLRSGTGCVTDPVALSALTAKFMTRGWSPAVFNKYYRSPTKLYTTSVAMPPLISTEAPDAFNEPGGQGWCWLVYYEGKIAHSEDIKFRFWGFGDDIIAVRVNGEIKIVACFPEWVTDMDDHTAHLWQSTSADNRKYPMGNHHSVVGDWIELKAGEPQDIEILLGETSGGIFSAMLLVEVEGVEYERNPHRGGPILPFFKTAEFSRDMVELIYNQLQIGDGTCAGGPIFNDYDKGENSGRKKFDFEMTPEPNPVSPPSSLADSKPELRSWTTADGKELEAKYVTTMGANALLESSRGKQKQVPIKSLSSEDQTYVSMLNPPQFKIDLMKTSKQRTLRDTTPWLDSERRLQITDNKFGVRLKQSTTSSDYQYPLEVEYFVFGNETDGSNYVLLDRQSKMITPSVESKGEYEVMGEQDVEMKLFGLAEGSMRGVKYGGFLVTIKDQHGTIVQQKTSHQFLYDQLGNLENIPVGKHFNKDCLRVMPPRPTDADRFTITL